MRLFSTHLFVRILFSDRHFFSPPPVIFFFFNGTATTEIYTLSLHDALPISDSTYCTPFPREQNVGTSAARDRSLDRKSTRLNSSHLGISYAVFCLKKKKITRTCNR